MVDFDKIELDEEERELSKIPLSAASGGRSRIWTLEIKRYQSYARSFSNVSSGTYPTRSRYIIPTCASPCQSIGD